MSQNSVESRRIIRTMGRRGWIRSPMIACRLIACTRQNSGRNLSFYNVQYVLSYYRYPPPRPRRFKQVLAMHPPRLHPLSLRQVRHTRLMPRVKPRRHYLVLYPLGNIAQLLISKGLARVMDWHAGLLTAGDMECLRAAEKTAKEKKLCLYASTSLTVTSGNGIAGSQGVPKAFEGTVVRIWSGDQISVIEKEGGKERRLQLSSTRGPK